MTDPASPDVSALSAALRASHVRYPCLTVTLPAPGRGAVGLLAVWAPGTPAPVADRLARLFAYTTWAPVTSIIVGVFAYIAATTLVSTWPAVVTGTLGAGLTWVAPRVILKRQNNRIILGRDVLVFGLDLATSAPRPSSLVAAELLARARPELTDSPDKDQAGDGTDVLLDAATGAWLVHRGALVATADYLAGTQAAADSWDELWDHATRLAGGSP